MRATALARAEQKRADEQAERWLAEYRRGLSPAKRAAQGLPILTPVEDHAQQATDTTQARAWEHTLLHGTPPDEQYLLGYHARVLFALENDLAVPDS